MMNEYDNTIYISPAGLRDCIEAIHDFAESLHGRANNYISSYDRYNNQSIMVAAACGMAAILLHDETTWFWNNEGKPDRWANTANAFLNRSMWKGPRGWYSLSGSDGPLAEAHKNHPIPYAEGPHYFAYAFECAIPYFRTYHNFLNEQKTIGTYTSSTFFGFEENVLNYYYDEDYDNLYQWYNEIRQPNSWNPAFDDSYLHSNFAALATVKTDKGSYNYFSDSVRFKTFKAIGVAGDRYSLHSDYLGANILEQYNTTTDTYHPESDMIFRFNANKLRENQHYMCILAEKGIALNGYKTLNYGHEHADGTSFLIGAGEDELAIDPAYFGYENRSEINDSKYHNMIIVTDDASGYNGTDADDPTESEPPTISTDGKYKSFKMSTTYDDYSGDVADVERQIEAIDKAGLIYYVINDKATNTNWVYDQQQSFVLNGNGSASDSIPTFTLDSEKKTAIWKYPCQKDNNNNDNWAMQATIQSDREITFNNGLRPHGNLGDKIDENSLGDMNGGYGQVTKTDNNHTRLFATVNVPDGSSAIFQTVIIPYKCSDPSPPNPPKLSMGSGYTTQLIKATETNDLSNFHISKKTNSTTTITNPFDYTGDNSSLYTDALNALLSYSNNRQFICQSCESNTNFRSAKISSGKTLVFRDTNFISSTQNIDAYISIAGKFKYSGFVKAPSGGSSVVFCVPDLEQGYPLIAKQGSTILSSIHNSDSNWNYITITFTEGITNFTIELADPCVLSCFFPSTATTLDTLFEFNTGTLETLGHDLQDVKGNGNLHITKGSKMSICPGFVFHNLDSIVMGDCVGNTVSGGDNFVEPDSSESVNPSGNTYAARNGNTWQEAGDKRISDHKRNMIIINDGAALVLDSGSKTHVGSFSTILVRKGGTLFVKAGAMLEIGDKCNTDRGELIAEDSAYVCVEEGADLHFFNDIDTVTNPNKDTVDRHFVYITMPRSNTYYRSLPTVNVSGARGKFLPDSIFEDYQGLAFCDWKIYNPSYGVNNREFGWCNLGNPVSRFSCPDTICKGQVFSIDGTRSLNEVLYRINVKRLLYNFYGVDTVMSYSRLDGRIGKKDLFTPAISGDYYVTLTTEDDCSGASSLTKYFHVPYDPIARFRLPETACSGYGTVLADSQETSFNGLNYKRYKWSVEIIIPDTLTDKIDITKIYGMQWEFDSSEIRQGTFDFPGYKWIGGFKYKVGFTIDGWCNSDTKYDTIDIPFMAFIDLAPAQLNWRTYLGPSAFKMEALSLGDTIDSFIWMPSTYLDDSTKKSVISTPTQDITYILEARSNGCVDYDTVTVSHKDLINAGQDEKLCLNDSVVIGADLNGPLLLGLINHVSTTNFATEYLPYDSMIPFDHRFTKFLIKTIPSSTESYVTDNDFMMTFLSNIDFRQKIQKRPWFRKYIYLYDSLRSSQPGSIDAIKMFSDTFVANDSEINYLIDSLGFSWPPHPYFVDLYNAYQTWYNNNAFGTTNIHWDAFSDDHTPEDLTRFEEHFYGTIKPLYGKTRYRITVTDADFNKVEYDEVDVWADSIPTPYFSPAYQLDSTVYFMNMSSINPLLPYSYSWNFGDGGSSTIENPIHTFNHYNDSFIVCLTVTNSCGSFVYCDTIGVDTISLYGLSKTAKSPSESNVNISKDDIKNSIKHLLKNTYQSDVVFLSQNIPNPFDKSSTIEYSIPVTFKKSSIVIYNMLGQQISNYDLKDNKGILVIDGSYLESGVYYIGLLVDDVLKVNRTLLIAK